MNAISPRIRVKVLPNGHVEPTNPVIIGPSHFNNDLANAYIYANNAAHEAYANAVSYTNEDLEAIDCGEF